MIVSNYYAPPPLPPPPPPPPQQVARSLCVKSGAVEQFSFNTELTSRDKDHVSASPKGQALAAGEDSDNSHVSIIYAFAAFFIPPKQLNPPPPPPPPPRSVTPHRRASYLSMVFTCGGVVMRRQQTLNFRTFHRSPRSLFPSPSSTSPWSQEQINSH